METVFPVPSDPTLIAELPNVRLNLSNKPENVSLVREALTGVAETIDLDRNDLNDVATAVTEACNNVVLHAYEGNEGPLEVEVYAPASAFEVVVRDHGTGIQPRIPTTDDAPPGLGLPVIQALAERVEFASTAGNGTEVRMEFAAASARTLEPLSNDRPEPPSIAQADLATTTQVSITPTRLAHTILPRILGALAARADFTTDRISDTHLVADALIAHAPTSISANHLTITINIEPRNLKLQVGPLRAGHAERLMTASAIEGLGPILQKLTSDHQTAAAGTTETLTLQLSDPQ
jgi:serine/threonine-protein kinase RsbW